MAISSGYSAEDLAKLGPDALTRKRMLAEALLAKSGGQRKIEHPLQGAAQMAEALVNGLRVRKLDEAEATGMKSGESAWSSLFGGSSSPSPGAASMPPTTGAGEQMAATSPSPATMDISGDKETFVSSLMPAAIEESKRTGVDPRIIVAQAAQETGWGKSAPGNNYFGIKSHGQGGGQTLATNEVIDGKTVRINDSFRQFANPQDSVKGYGDFILQNPRYRGMREAKGLDAQLEALGASGYATDPNYANSVGSIARGIKLPNEVASIDPAAGIPPQAAPQIPPAAAAYVDPTISAPNAQPQQTVAIQPANGLPPLAPPREVGTPPVPPNATPPQQMAQALTGGAAPPQRQGPSVQDLAKILENPWVSDDKKKIAQVLLGKQLERDDPMNRLKLEKEQLEIDRLRNPDADFINGRDGAIFRGNKRTGALEQVYGGKPEKFRTLTDDEERQMGLDPSKAYQIGSDDKIQQIGGGGTTVNIDQKAEGAFDKKLAEKQAETFSTMADEGMNARGDLAVIGELDNLLKGQGGALTGLSAVAAKYGVPVEGADDLQAASALINKLIPSQRTPGSGTMSDGDVAMFRASLPNLWNQPGGNQKILNTMRGMAAYKQAQGEIADQVISGDMSRQEARRALREIPNPLEEFRKASPSAEKAPVAAGPKREDDVPLEDLLKKYGG